MAEVALDNVGKVFPGGVTAVQDFTLHVADREFVVLVGPSGCGKSTTLRMVAGLEQATSGILRIGTRVVNDVPPMDRDVAMVFQNCALYPHMTVYKNMAFALTLGRLPKTEVDRRVRETARTLGIEPLLARWPRELSGGERQRVAVGRAIVRQPQAFLFDEPLSNLDARLRGDLRAELKRLHRRLRTTTLYVTHDQAEAMTLGDRVAVMNAGRIQQIGPPLAVYDYPANRFVAGFLGTPPMNFLPGRLAAMDGRPAFEVGGVRIALPPAMAGRVQSHLGRPVTLGVRPEDVGHAAAGRFAGSENVLPATVRGVEPLGDEQIVHLAGPADTVLACKWDARVPLEVDARLDARVDLARIHVFDDPTGCNISLEPENVAHAS